MDHKKETRTVQRKASEDRRRGKRRLRPIPDGSPGSTSSVTPGSTPQQTPNDTPDFPTASPECTPEMPVKKFPAIPLFPVSEETKTQKVQNVQGEVAKGEVASRLAA